MQIQHNSSESVIPVQMINWNNFREALQLNELCLLKVELLFSLSYEYFVNNENTSNNVRLFMFEMSKLYIMIY